MPAPGDRIKVITESELFEGILMPRPEILEKGITVIKLDNGYNLGIDKNKIKEIALIEKYTQKTKKVHLPKQNPTLPTITILSAGGTISSRVDYRTGGTYAYYTAEDFIAMCPELENIANIRAKAIMQIMSEDILPYDWKKMARAVAFELNSEKTEGVVLTMGTDTLHFAAAALSFFLKDINKPVIITAAQRSIDRGSSDAFMNLICSVIAAKTDIAEVMTCLHGTTNDDYCLLIKGTKVRKMHTSRRDAFRPINDLPIAKVFPDGKIEFIKKDYNKKANKKAVVDAKFEEKVALIQVYPGMEPKIIDFYLNNKYRGIVLSATALGHVPTNSQKQIITNIKKATQQGIPVIIASQTLYGRVHPLVYTNLRKLSMEANCIFVEDMLPETAYVKLGYVLGHTRNPEKIKEMMQTNIAGELTERSQNTFLY